MILAISILDTMALGKTLQDYQPSNSSIRQFVEIPSGDGLPPSFGNLENTAVSYGDVRTTKAADDGPSEGNKDFSYPPYFPFLTQFEDVLYLSMVQGYIYSYHGDSNDLDAMSELFVTGMPVNGATVAAPAGTKFWVVADEDEYGRLSNPAFSSGTDWPASTAPKLVGGSDQSGMPSFRIWRLSEVVLETFGEGEDAVEVPVLKIHRTGIIEHRVPRRLENLTNDLSQDEGRIYDQFDLESGEYQLRALRGKRGLRISEGEGEESDFVKLLMPEGVDGAVLYYQNGNPEDPEIGEWTKLDPPASGPTTGNIWVLSTPGGPLPPEWVEVSDDGGGAGQGVCHPWKVTIGNLTDPEDPETQGWDYTGGTVHLCGQGPDIVVADGTVTGSSGYVLLHITRDSSTREGLTAEVIWSATIPLSDYNDQYRVIAQVNPGYDCEVVQHQFEEIRLFEELVVINGAFALQAYEISHQNNYAPPI